MSEQRPWTTLVQITDTHLGREPRPLRPGYPDSDTQLERVLDEIGRRTPLPDLVLVTGDLAEDPETMTYKRLATRLASIGTRVAGIAGNHDEAVLAREAFAAAGLGFDVEAVIGRWLVVALDSAWPGHTEGLLSAAELARLESAIRRHRDHWVLVAVHHPPLPLGSRWLDALALSNGGEFLQTLHRYPRVRACVFGHAHQAFDRNLDGLRLLGTPSTCVQFLPGAEEFALDPIDAGYRVIHLHADGGLETGIERVPGTGRVGQP